MEPDLQIFICASAGEANPKWCLKWCQYTVDLVRQGDLAHATLHQIWQALPIL